MASLPRKDRAGSPAFGFYNGNFLHPGDAPCSSLPAAHLLRIKMTGWDLFTSPSPSFLFFY
jgi:hypothetical protein